MIKPVNSKLVMLIDDNEVDLKIHTKIISITRLFENVQQCNSGEEAILYLQKNLNDPEKLPCFILLDIQMPDMDGFAFLDNYKRFPDKIKDNISIAMLSSTLDFGDIQRAEANAYVVKLLKKPLNPMELKKLMNN
jgi:CheY-like chemotaxis protein